MSINFEPIEVRDVRCELENSVNMISFLSTALISIFEANPGADLQQDQIMGLQQILFRIESQLRAVENCFDENPHLLKPNQDERPATPKKAA